MEMVPICWNTNLFILMILNNMITEDFISYETAKLLKGKGFNECCYGYYYEPKHLSHNTFDITNSELEEDSCSAPTLQMAMKWLREVHRIHISITPLSFEDGIFWMYKTIKLWSDNNCSELHRSDSKVGFNTYEEACEAAIKYCLENLI